MTQSPCDQMRHRLEDRLDGLDLPASDAEALSRHLADCAGCQAYAAEMAAIDAHLSHLPPEPVPADLSDRVMARVMAVADETRPKAAFDPPAKTLAGWWQWLPVTAAAVILLMALPWLSRQFVVPSTSPEMTPETAVMLSRWDRQLSREVRDYLPSETSETLLALNGVESGYYEHPAEDPLSTLVGF